MVKELTDEQILEYLMTSDFIENYSPEEYKLLLFKFRSFYKILYGKHKLYKDDKEFELKNLQSTIDGLRNSLTQEQIKSSNLQNSIDLLTSERKLSWKERWEGKIKKF
jgi:hypothetical protein